MLKNSVENSSVLFKCLELFCMEKLPGGLIRCIITAVMQDTRKKFNPKS